MNPARALPACAALLLAACASSDGLVTRSTPADPARLEAARSFASVAVAAAAWPSERWWRSLGDPQLDKLIDEALASSPTLRLAQARLERARALAAAAGAPLGPQLSAEFDASRQRITSNGIYPRPIAGSWLWQNQALLDFSYDFDFWGRNAAAWQSALGEAKAAEADAQAARLVLSSAVALAYVQLAHAYDQRDVAHEQLALRERQLDLVRTRLGAGLDSQLEVRQSETTLPEIRQRIAQLDESEALARHQIAALLGRGPDRGLALARPALRPAAGLELPSRLPADLLGRRPDIAASRWRVEAAARGAASARAEFYPNVDLVAFVGLQAITWGHLLEYGSRVLGAGPALSLPIFDGGRLRGNLGAKSAEYDAAAEQYNQALADALREVADQVAAWRSVERQSAEVEAGLATAASARDLAQARFRAGLTGRLPVLTAEAQVAAQRGLAADLRARRLEAAIGLARALGGGYSGRS